MVSITNTLQTASVTHASIGDGSPQDTAFFGYSAPAGSDIKNVEFTHNGVDGSFQYIALDDLCFQTIDNTGFYLIVR